MTDIRENNENESEEMISSARNTGIADSWRILKRSVFWHRAVIRGLKKPEILRFPSIGAFLRRLKGTSFLRLWKKEGLGFRRKWAWVYCFTDQNTILPFQEGRKLILLFWLWRICCRIISRNINRHSKRGCDLPEYGTVSLLAYEQPLTQ